MYIIEDSKSAKKDRNNILVAYAISIISCAAIAEGCHFLLLGGLNEYDGLLYWGVTITQFVAIAAGIILLIAAVLYGLGFGGKREVFKNIF